MYVLFLFYRACAPDMAAAHPLGKFLTIKAVVFLSFWQVLVFIIYLFSKGEGRGVGSSDI